jgi:hypothetical protein
MLAEGAGIDRAGHPLPRPGELGAAVAGGAGAIAARVRVRMRRHETVAGGDLVPRPIGVQLPENTSPGTTRWR